MSDPFFYPAADEPYIEATMGCVLVGENLQVCNETLCRTPAAVPVPLKLLTNRGDLVTSNAAGEPKTLALGKEDQYLSSTFLTPVGLEWSYLPCHRELVSGDQFSSKGDLLIGNGVTGPLEVTATALPVGQDRQFLTVDSSSETGLSWTTNPYYIDYGGKGRLLASDSNCCTVRVSGVDGNVLVYCDSAFSGWTGTDSTANFLPQAGFQKGNLAIGSGIDTSDKSPTGPDGYALRVDINGPSGIGWKDISSYPTTATFGCIRCCTTYDQGNPTCICLDQIPGSSFPGGSQVFAVINFTVFDNYNEGIQNGYIYMCQGNSQSAKIPYDNFENPATNACLYTISYILPTWDSACPLTLVYESICRGALIPREVIFCAQQTNAFVLQGG